MLPIETFAKEATAFLESSADPATTEGEEWGVGDDTLSSYVARSPDEEMGRVRAARGWKALEFDAGFGWITGPEDMGGRGLTPEHARRYLELRSHYAIPPLTLFAISLGMVAPTFLKFGQPDVRELVLRLHRGDLIGCQLFSEPGAGSDVAGLSTQAVRDGDEWVLNGQKVWTSGAHLSEWGLLLARSDPQAPKHQGITAFALDMTLPGVDVRPLKMITGGTEFNEVFLHDVRVGDRFRLGDVNGGWKVAIATLMNERAVGAAGDDAFGVLRCLERLRMTIALPGMGRDDPVVRQRLAQIYSMAETIRYQSIAADERRRAGLPPGPAESVFKLASTEALRRIVALAGEVIGPRAIADAGEWGMYAWADMILTVPGMRIAGGTDEVMRNILGERVLGLPKEPVPIED